MLWIRYVQTEMSEMDQNAASDDVATPAAAAVADEERDEVSADTGNDVVTDSDSDSDDGVEVIGEDDSYYNDDTEMAADHDNAPGNDQDFSLCPCNR